MAYSAGGDLIYWVHPYDFGGGVTGSFDISLPNTRFFPSTPDASREWTHFSYDVGAKMPGYNFMYQDARAVLTMNCFMVPTLVERRLQLCWAFPILPSPMLARCICTFTMRLSPLATMTECRCSYQWLGQRRRLMCTYHSPRTTFGKRLTAEVNKVIASGHLRPGYRGVGVLDGKTADQLGDHLIDYWHRSI